MTKRPLNRCRSCAYEWYPRGKNLSASCPLCGSTETYFAHSEEWGYCQPNTCNGDWTSNYPTNQNASNHRKPKKVITKGFNVINLIFATILGGGLFLGILAFFWNKAPLPNKDQTKLISASYNFLGKITKSRHYKRREVWIIYPKGCYVRKSPNLRAKIVGEVEKGVAYQLVTRKGGWKKIRFSLHKKGWVGCKGLRRAGNL